MFGENQQKGPAYYRDAPEAQRGMLKVTEIFYTLQGEGPYAGHPAVFIRLTHCHLACHFCFPAQETIETVNRGPVTFAEIEAGDVLPTIYQGHLTETKVVGTGHRPVERRDLWRLVVRGGWESPRTVICTYDHPFKPVNGEWVAASQLKPGDQLVGWNGGERPFDVLESTRATDDNWNKVTRYNYPRSLGAAQVVSLKCAPHPFHLHQGLLAHNCDTMFDEGQWYTHQELVEKVNSIRGAARLVVITGGEPTLQAANLPPLISSLLAAGMKVQMETAGNLPPQSIDRCSVVISPKVAGKQHLKPHPGWFQTSCDLHLKFPVDAEEGPYHMPPSWVNEEPYSGLPVYLTPINCYLRKPLRFLRQGSAPHKEPASFWEEGLLNMERNQRNHEWAATLCLRHGYRLSLQTHLYASIP